MHIRFVEGEPLKHLLCSIILLFTASCAPIVQAPLTTHAALDEKQSVLLVQGSLPPSVQYETLGPLEVRLPPPGNVAAFDKARSILATEARKIGANAILHVSTKYTWTIAGWTTFGTGTAIRLPTQAAEHIAAMPHVKGEWR